MIAFFTSWKYAHLFHKLCKRYGLLIVDFESSKTRAFKVIICLLSKEYCNQENFKLKYKYHNCQEQVMGELGLDPKNQIYKITIHK